MQNNNKKFDQNENRERKINKKRNVAIVGFLNSKKQILLVRTKRLPSKWQPVGGGIDNNETPITAIIREAKEETNITINTENLQEIVQLPYDYGEGTIYFYTSVLDDNHNIKFNHSEILEHNWFSLSDAKRLPLFNATEKFINILIEKEYKE